VNESDLAPDERTDPAASSERPRTDGGALAREADAKTEILEKETWDGPHVEYDRGGTPTGTCYYRRRDCGREVLAEIDMHTASHRDECRFGAEH